MHHTHKHVSWPEEFLDGFTAIPHAKTTFTLMQTVNFKSFVGALTLRRALTWDKKHPMSVWQATANGQNYIVKKFRPRDDGAIIRIIKTFPEAFDDPREQFEQIRQDTDPFVLERRAYERIDRFSSKGNKAFFPIYYGSSSEKRALVIEPLQSSPSLKSRCICSNSVPAYLENDLQLLREELGGKELSSLETKWYESLLIDRLKRLTALHSIGITHGDIKEDCFRLPGDFHDTVLFDFSHAYTITLQRPHAVQGYVIDSRYSERWSIWRSMEKLVQLERRWLRSLIAERSENEDFRLRYGHPYEDDGEMRFIVMKVFREPEELGFPSFASLLPFLEAASPNNSKAWAISQAGRLKDYVALWIQSRHNNHDLDLLAMVAYSGEILCSWPSTTPTDGQYNLILIPRAWLMEGLEVSREFVSKLLSTQYKSQQAWTIDRTSCAPNQ